MSKNKIKKISEGDLESINALNLKKTQLNERMVRLAWMEIDLKLGKDKNEADAIELSKEESAIAERLEEEYGKITNLNVETGEYTVEG